MKRFSILSLALALVLVAGCAFAEEFKYFKAEVPAGWTAQENEQEGATNVIIAKEGVASLTISVAPTGGAALDDIAKELSKALDGTEPQADEKGNRIFTCNNEDTLVIVNANDEKQIWVAMSITGADKAEDDMNALMDSLEWK